MSDQEKDRSAATAAEVVEILKKEKLTVTVMESCTSGLIASMITDTQGASEIFFGGYVTYANSAKIAAGVDKKIIEKYGVYSEECAHAMALAAKNAFNTDISIGITGTTGNVDPNNQDSVQGEVYFCILSGSKVYPFHVRQNVAGMSRHEIKQAYADAVFTELLNIIR